jgi:hypothetical protein
MVTAIIFLDRGPTFRTILNLFKIENKKSTLKFLMAPKNVVSRAFAQEIPLCAELPHLKHTISPQTQVKMFLLPSLRT